MPGRRASIRSVVATFLEADGWPATWHDDTVEVLYEGVHGLWRCHGIVLEDEERFIFYSIAPLTVTRRKSRAVAEFLHRANDGMVLGCFEFSWDRGEVRFRTSIDVEGGALSETMVRTLIETNVQAMDRYLPMLTAVARGTAEPAAAVADTEE